MAGVELLSEVRGPAPEDLRDRRDDYWRFLERLLLGAVRYRDGTIYGLGLPLIRTGPAEFRSEGWVWPIRGGLLVARPGGEIGFGVEDGHLVGFLRGYRPLLPAPLYRFTQRPVHQLITRLFLLHERGRREPPGVPAAPAARLAAGAFDAGLVFAATRLLGRRAGTLLGAGYLVAAWASSGQTLGQRLLGIRAVSTDGSGITPAQAILRLALLPATALRLRAVHDEVAGTEVVES